MSRRFILSICAAVIYSVGSAAVLPCPTLAQGTKADYERAARLPNLLRNGLVRANIRPHWIGEADGKPGHRFWYRADLGNDKREYVLVDPDANPVRRPAFDPIAVAAALTKILGKSVSADALPIEWLVFESDGTLRVQSAGKAYRWNPTDKTLTAIDGLLNVLNPLPINGRIPRSRDGGVQSEITFVNRTDKTFNLYWVKSDGERLAYGTILAGVSRRQNSFAGHAWLLTDSENTPVMAFVAGEVPSSAVIELPVRNSCTPPTNQSTATPSTDVSRPETPTWKVLFRNKNAILANGSGVEIPLTGDAGTERLYAERYAGQQGYYWSPDRKKLALLRFTPGEEHTVTIVESSPAEQIQPKLQSFQYYKPGDKIPTWKPRLFDLTDPERPREIPVKDDLYPNPYDIGDFAWSADSARFRFLYNQRGHQVVRLVSVDAVTGAAKTIAENVSPTFVDYAHKNFVQYLDETNEVLWMSERDGWCHLYRYNLTTGQLKNRITQGEWVIRGVDRVDVEKKQIYFRAGGIVPGQDPYYVHYCRVNFDGTGLTRLTDGDGTHTVSYSPDGKYLVDTWSRVDLPPVTELRRTEDGTLVTTLEKADAASLQKNGWRFPERFVAKARDGKTDIYGIIVYPTNFDPKKKYPVIEEIYAGPQGAFVPKAFSTWFGNKNELAELGFIVVQIDGMGTSHRSKAFHDVCWRNIGDAGLPDRVLWIKAAAKTRPCMDLTRVGIFGGSAGGQNSTRALLTHSDFYKVAVSDCGCHDNRMDKIWWNELWMGWPVGKEYAESSNVTYAKNLTGKLLLVVGELDTNVDPASTMQVVNALVKADRDFDLLVIPGAGHGAAESPYGKRRRADFFVRHLLGVEPRR
jgi:dipeptidyl-peptidase 4